MYFDNVPAQFYSNAGDSRPTSKYYIFKNGLVRAKTAIKELIINPGKNIVFFKSTENAVIRKSKPKKIDKDKLTMTMLDGKVYSISLSSTATYNKVMDFYLDDSGNVTGGSHRGHVVADVFDAGNSGLLESLIDTRVASLISSTDKSKLKSTENKRTVKLA